MNTNKKKYAVFVVPTGIGASIGGYAGDASCYARKLAKKIPLIVNPNVVNAACYSGITQDMLYVEGWTLEAFFKKEIGLRRSENNTIGVIFDSAIPQEILNVHINTINAIKTVYGFNVIDYVLTENPVDVKFFIDETGISTGGIKNEIELLKAGQALKAKGAQTIAIVCYFNEPEEDNYENGDGVDIIGGIEGIISHYLSKELKLPCVHAPAFSNIEITTKLIHPKASAEYITPTFLPCLFFGLENAPLITTTEQAEITIDNIKALILPYNALGNTLVFEAIKHNIKIYAIQENKTILNVTAKNLNIAEYVTIVNSYNDLLNIL